MGKTVVVETTQSSGDVANLATVFFWYMARKGREQRKRYRRRLQNGNLQNMTNITKVPLGWFYSKENRNCVMEIQFLFVLTPAGKSV